MEPMTAKEIDDKRSLAGGWTKAQLAEWGVPWPPPKGWRKALIRGERPEYRRPKEERLADALNAAQLAIDEYYNGNRDFAERWLLIAYEANKVTI